MHIHILGICGTFMGGVAQLAREAGVRVTGSDEHVYPPMSDALKNAGIEITQGYRREDISINPDIWVVGNAISRGNPLLEAILDEGLPYTSGPQWLSENILQGREVLAVAGTHGKTTTTSMLAWILSFAGIDCGYLIGGVPQWSPKSARLGSLSSPFVIEADEYDTALSDKRSKFVHYKPKVAILNNLEFDHADIFENLAAIEKEFHHLVRIMPQNGTLIVNATSQALQRVLDKGVWSHLEYFAHPDFWDIDKENCVKLKGDSLGKLNISMTGRYNELNALAAIAAAKAIGVSVEKSLLALAKFAGVKRRQEVKGVVNGITVIDDFAHHPTAIFETINAIREKMAQTHSTGRLLAVLEPRSNTMKMGVMKSSLASSLVNADKVYCYSGKSVKWEPAQVLDTLGEKAFTTHDIDELISKIVGEACSNDTILCMSNGAFCGIHTKLVEKLKEKFKDFE